MFSGVLAIIGLNIFAQRTQVNSTQSLTRALSKQNRQKPNSNIIKILLGVADSKLCAARGRMKYNSNDNKLYLHNHIFAKIIAKVNLIYVAGCF